MSDNDLGPTFAFPEITAAPPGGYQRDKRFKLGEAGERFIQRHIPQARKLVETFSNPPTTINRIQYGAFKAEKFAQWKSNGLAADADTQVRVYCLEGYLGVLTTPTGEIREKVE